MIKVLLTALPILMLSGISQAEPQEPNPVTREQLRQTLYGWGSVSETVAAGSHSKGHDFPPEERRWLMPG